LILGKKKGRDFTVAVNAARLSQERAKDTDETLILKTDDERCHKETGVKKKRQGREEGVKNCLKND
jgi:hypothetical protein